MNITQTLHDPTLPHLATALDCGAMRTIFQQALFADESTLHIMDCQIERMKYKPGKSCLISYRSCLCDGNDQRQSRPQIITAQGYPEGESQRRFERALQAPLVEIPGLKPLLHLPALEMVAWIFPNDAKLVGLPRLMDTKLLRNEILPPIVNNILADTTVKDGQITQLTHTLVHYSPQQTCTVRVEIETENRAQPIVLYGKTYYNDDGAETDRLMHALWQEPAHQNNQLTFAKPLGYDPHNRILWQLGLAGKPLIALEEENCFAGYLQKAAQAVASLHQCHVQPNRQVDDQQWVTKLSEMRTVLASLRPECQQQSERIINHLLAKNSHLEKDQRAPLHGDLHLQNFLVNDGTIAMIDMDNLITGSPWQDVGSFVAGLYYRGLIIGRSFSETEAHASSFCQAYARSSQWDYSSTAVNWYSAAALINERAYRTISRWKGGKLDLIDDLLDCAERILEL